MKKLFEGQIRAETVVRELGSNGMLLGHWLLVDAITERLAGRSAQEAVRCSAALHGISPRLAYSRIRGVICCMAKVRSERYAELWDIKKPTPRELVEKITDGAGR